MTRSVPAPPIGQYPYSRSRALLKHATAYLYVAPALIALLAVVAWPLLSAVSLSLHESYLLKGLNEDKFVGLGNFMTFFHDPRTWTFMTNTAIYVGGSTIGDIVVGMSFAVLLHRPMPLRAVWRALAIVPWAMPISVAAITWRWILNGQWGILNYGLSQLGLIDRYVAWLSQSPWIWPSLLMVSVWINYPFAFVSLLAGLQGIPQDLFEAARIDGVGATREFVHITLPLLRPVIAATVLLLIILHMREFATIWVITFGGPGIATTTLSPLVYIVSFRYFRMGMGAAIGMVLLAVNLLFTWLYLRQVRFGAEGIQETV